MIRLWLRSKHTDEERSLTFYSNHESVTKQMAHILNADSGFRPSANLCRTWIITNMSQKNKKINKKGSHQCFCTTCRCSTAATATAQCDVNARIYRDDLHSARRRGLVHTNVLLLNLSHKCYITTVGREKKNAPALLQEINAEQKKECRCRLTPPSLQDFRQFQWTDSGTCESCSELHQV